MYNRLMVKILATLSRSFSQFVNELNHREKSKQLSCFISPCVNQEETIFQVVKNTQFYSYIAPVVKAASTLRFLIVPSS